MSGYLFTSAYIASREPLDGLDNGKWRVNGHELCIEWESDDASVAMTGPASHVFEGRIDVGGG